MTLRDFLIAISVITALALASLVVVLMYVNPEVAGFVGISVFYISLFLVVLGVSMLLGLAVRVVLQRITRGEVLAFKLVLPALRQSVWFAALVTTAFWLLAQNLFNWWSLIILLAALAVLEGFYAIRGSSLDVPNRPVVSEEE